MKNLDIAGLAKSFQPRHWWNHCALEGADQGKIMWVYRATEDDKWQVGFFYPDGTWFADGTFGDRDRAAARVNWLNGGHG